MKKNNFWNLFSALVVLSMALAACGAPSATATSAFCGFVVGNGSYNSDLKDDGIIYPGDEVRFDTLSYDYRTVPCNSRNFQINDGTKFQGDGVTKIGDYHQPITANTANGTPVLVTGESYWTLNQSTEAMSLFWTICQKYRCWNENDNISDSNNFSSAGWNGLLAENYLPAFTFAIKMAIGQLDDGIIDNTKRNQEIADLMPKYFLEYVRKTHGFSEIDIFCGSGESVWVDENNRGPNGTFRCADVRFTIADVQLDTLKLTTVNSTYLDAQRLAQAKFLYGEDAAQCVLAHQDALAVCQEGGGTCINNVDFSVCYQPNMQSDNAVEPYIIIPTDDPFGPGSGTSATPEATPAP